MQTLILAVVVGLAGGVAVGLQGPLASLMSQRVGTMGSVFIIHLGGALMAGAVLLVIGGGNLAAWRSVPWYALGAGVFGLVILSAVSYTIPRIGAAVTGQVEFGVPCVVGGALSSAALKYLASPDPW